MGNLFTFFLQGMWEDNKTRSKWVIANQCYFPSDLPDVVGHPSAPESNEVNHFCDKFSPLFSLVFMHAMEV